MPSLAAAQTFNAGFCPSYIPVAIFVGGTANIGEVMAKAFARYTNGRAHIIIVGRNRNAAETTIASFPKPTNSNEWNHEFIPCDVQLIKNVKETTRAILSRVLRVNYLVLSAGINSLAGRENTEEGLDRKMVIRYYSRWAFIDGLLPGLLHAKESGQDAKVLTILAAGYSPKIDASDLGLKKNFTGLRAMLQCFSYTDLMVAEYASRYPELAFTHIAPGTVNVKSLVLEHWILRTVEFLIRLARFFAGIPPEACAEYMWFAIFSGEKGMFFKDSYGDDIGLDLYQKVGTVADQKLLWNHTEEEMKRIQL